MGKAIEKVNPGRKRNRFTKEFKLEAVRLLELGEKPATQLAAELGIRHNQLHKWQEQMRSKGPQLELQQPVVPSFALIGETKLAGYGHRT